MQEGAMFGLTTHRKAAEALRVKEDLLRTGFGQIIAERDAWVRLARAERDRALQKLDASEQRVTRVNEALRQCREQQARHATSRDDKVAALQAEVARLGKELESERKRSSVLAMERDRMRAMQQGVTR